MEYRNIRKTGEKGKTEHTGKIGNKKNMGKLRKWENQGNGKIEKKGIVQNKRKLEKRLEYCNYKEKVNLGNIG